MPKPEKPDSLKHWAMIVFESVSAGMIAVVLVLCLVLVIEGLYVQLVWPLTGWELTGINFEQYRPMITTGLSLIFVTGMMIGFWFFSGAAWGGKGSQSAKARGARTRPS